jgi:hypothetical protein
VHEREAPVSERRPIVDPNPARFDAAASEPRGQQLEVLFATIQDLTSTLSTERNRVCSAD